MYISNGALRKRRPCGLWIIPALMWSIFNLIGLFIIAMAWVGGRITRRYINRPLHWSGRTSTKDSREDAWAEKPLIAPSEV